MTMLLLAVLAFLAALGIAAIVAFWLFSRNTARKVEAGIPPAGRFTEVSGGQIHSVEAGSGRPIVMIHGLSGNLHNFTYATTAPLAGDYHVIAVDRPGCGYSERRSDDLARIPEQARMIAEFLEAEGIEKPLIVGHSLGGAVALTLAINHPERVGGLALVSPLVVAQEVAPPLFKGIDIPNPLMRRIVAETIAVPMSIRNGAATLAAVFSPNKPPADFGVKGGGLLGLRPRAFYAASTDLHCVPDGFPEMRAHYGEIAVPTGILYGADDAVLNADENVGALKAALPGLDVEVLSGIGHMPLVAAPGKVEAFIRRMAAKVFA